MKLVHRSIVDKKISSFARVLDDDIEFLFGKVTFAPSCIFCSNRRKAHSVSTFKCKLIYYRYSRCLKIIWIFIFRSKREKTHLILKKLFRYR